MGTKKALTKEDIAHKLFLEQGFPKAFSRTVVGDVFDELRKALCEGDVKVAGFGTFRVLDKKPRQGRNPHTGDPIRIEARKSISFRPSKLWKQKLGATKK